MPQQLPTPAIPPEPATPHASKRLTVQQIAERIAELPMQDDAKALLLSSLNGIATEVHT